MPSNAARHNSKQYGALISCVNWSAFWTRIAKTKSFIWTSVSNGDTFFYNVHNSDKVYDRQLVCFLPTHSPAYTTKVTILVTTHTYLYFTYTHIEWHELCYIQKVFHRSVLWLNGTLLQVFSLLHSTIHLGKMTRWPNRSFYKVLAKKHRLWIIIHCAKLGWLKRALQTYQLHSSTPRCAFLVPMHWHAMDSALNLSQSSTIGSSLHYIYR